MSDARIIWGDLFIIPLIKDAAWPAAGHPSNQYMLNPAPPFTRGWEQLTLIMKEDEWELTTPRNFATRLKNYTYIAHRASYVSNSLLNARTTR